MRRRVLQSAMFVTGVMALGCSSGAMSAGEEMSMEEATAVAVAQLEASTGHAWSVGFGAKRGAATYAEGRAEGQLRRGTTPIAATYDFLARHRGVFGVEAPDLEYKRAGADALPDADGYTHVRLQQHVRGIPVFGGELISHYDASGALTSVSTQYFPKLRDFDVNPAFGVGEGRERAIRHWKSDFQPTFDVSDLEEEARAELGVYIDPAGTPILAYSVEGSVNPSDTHDPARLAMMIDAKSGRILEAIDGSETITGWGIDELNITRLLEVSSTGSNFSLIDTSRGTGRITTSSLNGATTGTGTVCTAPSANGTWDPSCVGAHRNAAVVYDYYKQVHGRNSLDNAGLPLSSAVHVGNKWNNAAWNGKSMFYGDGDQRMLLNTTRGLDVGAHEMTHGVTATTSKLGYSPGTQNAALNESMSDIFGALVENWAQPDAVKNWQLGEDIVAVTFPRAALRFMSDPTADGLSIDHASKFVSGPRGTDPHKSSGVANNAFYLMTMGGTNKTSKIRVSSGIGWSKAGKVMFLTQSSYLKSTDGWLQMANANIAAAKQLGLTQNEQYIIECAWIAVGGITSRTTCRNQ